MYSGAQSYSLIFYYFLMIHFIFCNIYRITESKHSSYPVGKYFVTSFGWRDKTIINLNKNKPGHFFHAQVTELFEALNTNNLSLGLGIVGMPG